MLREALLRQETITSNVLNEFETNEALTQTLRRENEIQLETNSRQKAALVALQISLKEEIELARSRSAFRDDSIVQEEEAMAQLLESRREYSDLGRRDDLVRSDLLHANAEILALRKEITAERCSGSPTMRTPGICLSSLRALVTKRSSAETSCALGMVCR